jgi:hypothetical protein
MWKNVRQPDAPSVSAASLLVVPLAFHQGEKLARDERRRHEEGGDHHAGQGEDDLDVVGDQPGADDPVRSEEQTNTMPDTTGETGERRVDDRHQDAAPGKVELGDGPRRGHTEDDVDRDDDRRDGQRQPDRRHAPWDRRSRRRRRGALLERLDEDRDQRQEEEQHEERQRDADQRDANAAAFVAMRGRRFGVALIGLSASAAAPPRGARGR